eukprot:242754_1
MDDIPEYDTYSSSEAHYSELMNFLSESSSMRQTAKSSMKQSLYAASGAFAGSFVGGPIGGLVGGVAGSIVGFIKGDDYDGAIVALTKLERDRQQRLMKEVFVILKTAGSSLQSLQNIEAFRETLFSFAQQEHVRNGIWSACVNSARS